MKLLATCTGVAPGSWELHHHAESDRKRWRALVLLRPPEARRRREHATERRLFFAWNGDRLSVTADFHYLRAKWPAVLDWLNETLPTVTWWEVEQTNRFRAAPGETPAVSSGERR
jgi:hypothetical protein